MNSKQIISSAAFLAAFSVAMGAFAAHGLKSVIEDVHLLDVFEKGVRYQFYHTFGLFITGLLMEKYPTQKLERTAWFFLFGILLFSGSLYLMTFTGLKWLGAITPFGGVCFLAGWLWMGYSFVTDKKIS